MDKVKSFDDSLSPGGLLIMNTVPCPEFTVPPIHHRNIRE